MPNSRSKTVRLPNAQNTAPTVPRYSPGHPEVAAVQSIQLRAGALGRLQVRLPRVELLVGPDHHEAAVGDVGALHPETRDHSRIDAILALEELVDQLRI